MGGVELRSTAEKHRRTLKRNAEKEIETRTSGIMAAIKNGVRGSKNESKEILAG